MRIDIKPFSANRLWKGRRYKTKEYQAWRDEFGWLSKGSTKHTGYLEINLKFYIKSFKVSDVDNLIKPTLDALQENRIIENDKYVLKVSAEKFHSKDERIEINITPYEEPQTMA